MLNDARVLVADTPQLLDHLRDRLPQTYALQLQQTTEESCRILDTNTDALRHQGKLLAHCGRRLTLWGGPAPVSARWEGAEPAFKGDIADAALLQAMGSVPKLRRLIPTLHFKQIRHRAALLDDNAKTCARFMAWTIQTGQGGGTIVLLRPVRGYGEELALLEAALQALGASPDLTVVELFTRLGCQGHGYASSRPIELRPDTPVLAAACGMIRNNLAIARANERGVIDDLDTEHLHDYRVSLRRVRSIISLLKGAYRDDVQQSLKERFSELMRSTNRLRDLDVYLLDRASYYPLLPPTMHPGLDQIFAAFQKERDEQWRKLARHFRSKAYRQTMAELERSFARDDALPGGSLADAPSLDYAKALIARRYRKVCRIAMSIDADTPDETVHALRLQCKKLRYLLDFFTPLFDEATIKRLITSLKQLQDNLGRFNDYSVQQLSLQAFLDGQLQGEAPVSPGMIEAVGALVAIKHQLQRQERALVMEKFAGFHSEETDAIVSHVFCGPG